MTLMWDAPGLMAGVDEAGRGPLAGPVVAAAVILNPDRPIEGLDDSKKLTAKRRERLFDEIQDKALCLCIAELAMQRAVAGLRLQPVKVQVDGNQLPALPMLCEPVVGGDALVPAISAASILAKVHRDRWCARVDAEWPEYGFAKHKGYGTAAHMHALQTLGPCELHRRSFAPVAKCLAFA
jgi:ribonuclease HII